MKKYFLTVIGESKFDSEILTDIGVALGSIVDSKYMNFNYSESFVMFHFESSVNKEDMYTFIKGVLFGLTETFVLTEISDNFSISLPAKMNFIFDLEKGDVNNIVNNIFLDEDYEDYDEDDDYEVYNNIMETYRRNLQKLQPKISLDSLLDKINETGIDSLSEGEKKFLENYSK